MFLFFLPPLTLDILAVDVCVPAFVSVVLVTLIVSPLTPLVALAVGPCAEPLYTKLVVLPHVTSTDFAFILQLNVTFPVLPSVH